MDYEKLIEELRSYTYWLGQDGPESHDIHPLICDDAATALATIQAENERLKNKLSELAHLPFDNPGVGERTRLMAENAQLRDELEQAKAEIIRLKHYEDKCHDCPIVCAKTEIIKAHEELEAVQAELEQKSKLIAQQAAELERRDKLLKEQETELEQVKRERDAAVDCIYKIEDALDRGNDNDWAREHISEWESQKED